MSRNPDPHFDFNEWHERSNEDYILIFGDPIEEVELDYAMEKMGVTWDDPNYGYWRHVAKQSLQDTPPPEERPYRKAA